MIQQNQKELSKDFNTASYSANLILGINGRHTNRMSHPVTFCPILATFSRYFDQKIINTQLIIAKNISTPESGHLLHGRFITRMLLMPVKDAFLVFVFFLDRVGVGEGAGTEEFVFLEIDGAIDGDGNGLHFLVFDGEWYYFYAIIGIRVGAEEGAFFAGVHVAGELGVVCKINDEFLVVFVNGDIAVNGVVVGAGVCPEREFGLVSFGYEAAVFFEGVFVLSAFFDGALPGVFAVVAVGQLHIGINDLLAEGAVEAVLISVCEDYDAEVEFGHYAGGSDKAIGATIVADDLYAIIIFEKPAEAIGLKMF